MAEQLDTRPLAHTINRACALLSLSRATVYRLIGQGALDARKLAGRTVIMDDSIRRFLANAPRLAPAA